MSSNASTPGPAVPSAPHGHPRRALPLLISNALDASGRQGADLALDVLAVTVLGATAAQMGVLNAVGTLAFLLLGVPVGVMVDRSPTTRLLLGSGLIRAALLSSVVTAWALGALSMPHLYVVAALAGTAGVVTETAQSAIATRVAGPGGVSHLVGRMQSAESVIGLVVPAGAGALIAVLGAGPTLAVTAAVIAVGAVVVLKLTVTTPAPEAPTGAAHSAAPVPPAGALGRFFREAAQGWTALRRRQALWRLTWGALAINLGLSAYSAVEVVLVLRVLDLGSLVLGLLLAAGALGGLAGSLLAVPVSRRWSVEISLRAFTVLLVPVAALPLAALADPVRAAGWLGAGALLWGLVMVAYNVLLAGLAAELTPAELMGRVSATRRTLTMGAVPLGGVVGGLLADQWGVAVPVTVWVVLNAVGAVCVMAALTGHRRRDPAQPLG